MDIFSVVHAGILATAAMTALLYATAWITGSNVKVVKILGTMLTRQTREDGGCSDNPFVILVGMISHYLVGIGFAIAYWLLINYEVLNKSWQDALIYGNSIGVVAVIVWRLYFFVHVKPPKVPLFLFLSLILAGHNLLALLLYAFMKSKLP